MKKHYRSDKNCLNCGTTVTDKFCSNCGQENIELKEDFLHVAIHSIGHYFHFESKFFNSIVPLFTKPGMLTKEYFEGKRASHLNPISMYIFISILFFFLFTANSNINRKGIIKENTPAENMISQAELEEAKAAVKDVVPAEMEHVVQSALDQATPGIHTSEKNEAVVVYTNAAPSTTAQRKTPAEEAILNQSANEENTLSAKFKQVMNDDLSSELFMNKLWSHLPKMMFILLPLFALILMLVNRNSKKFYVEHLIYSIHIHSFIFLFFSVLILLSWLVPALSDWLSVFGLLVVVWYIYRSMRNIYGSTRWRTIYKFFLLSFVYSFLLAASGALVFVATLYTM